MAKVQIKSEKLTPFGGIFSIMEQFDALLAQTIDSTLGLRCTMFGYQYSEILRSLMCVYLCGGSCIEDVTTHLMKHLSLHPTLRTCSADTILRAIEELTCKNITYKSASGNSYDFNTADKMNCLLIKALLATGQLKSGQEYDFDFDHQFIETEKYDAKPTYKKFFYDMNNGSCFSNPKSGQFPVCAETSGDGSRNRRELRRCLQVQQRLSRAAGYLCAGMQFALSCVCGLTPGGGSRETTAPAVECLFHRCLSAYKFFTIGSAVLTCPG